MGTKIDLTGQRFGRLVVVKMVGVDNRGECTWECKCDCGNITHPIKGSTLRLRKSQSCGCLQKEKISERSSTHRGSQTRLYNIWSLMKRRCNNPKSTAFNDYGGRGITVCDEWKNDFQAFYEWSISNGYDDNLSIDRIDVNGNYEPSNCRWASQKVQTQNRRCAVIIKFKGKAQTLSEWAEESGIPYKTLHTRYSKGDRDVDLFRPIVKKSKG